MLLKATLLKFTGSPKTKIKIRESRRGLLGNRRGVSGSRRDSRDRVEEEMNVIEISYDYVNM